MRNSDLSSAIDINQRLILIFSKVRLAYEHIEQRKQQGMTNEDASNNTAIELIQCAEAHCRAFLLQSAYEMSKNNGKTLSPELCAALDNVIELYALDTCMRTLGDLLRVSWLLRFQIGLILTATPLVVHSSPAYHRVTLKNCNRIWRLF